MHFRRQAAVLVACCAVALGAPAWSKKLPANHAPAPASGGPALFDRDPNHIWNRTHGCLFVRHDPASGAAYGGDALDPALWANTKFLLAGDSHRQALRCLDEFLNTHAERLVSNPLMRAVFQRDLWAVFDWAANNGWNPTPERQALMTRLAQIMRRVAITPEQARSLPDNYTAAARSEAFAAQYDPAHPGEAFLPRDLFAADGSWTCLSSFQVEPTATGHFDGRSRFLVFMRLPGGREETVQYVERLRASGEPVFTDAQQTRFNPRLPQFPVGTEVALVRQLLVITSDGEEAATPVTESVQLRVYHAITPGPGLIHYIQAPSRHDQDAYEFRLSRALLAEGKAGGLVAVRADEAEHPTLFSFGIDPFETSRNPLAQQAPIMRRCEACHGDTGVHAVASLPRWLPNPAASLAATEFETQPVIDWETRATIARKRGQAEFKLLQQYWQSAPRESRASAR